MQSIQVTNKCFLQLKKSRSAQLEICAKKKINQGEQIEIASFSTNEKIEFKVLMIIKLGFETQTLFLGSRDENFS